MPQSINLIPQQEKQEQQKTAIVKASTVFSIVLLIIVAGVSAYLFIQTRNYRNELNLVEMDIEEYRESIQARANFEIDARNLDKKYNILNELFQTRIYYSNLLKEMEIRRPSGVTITSFDVRKDQISISGYATSYISVAGFINNLLGDEGKYLYENMDLSDLFSEVKLNSVSLDSGNNEVKYGLSVTYDPSKLVEY